MRRAAASLLASLLMLVFSLGCASTQDWRETTKKTVVASTEVYDVTMQSLGDLYAAGQLSEANKERSILIANGYRTAALAALAAAEMNDPATVDQAIADMSAAVRQLIEMIRESTGGSDE